MTFEKMYKEPSQEEVNQMKLVWREEHQAAQEAAVNEADTISTLFEALNEHTQRGYAFGISDGEVEMVGMSRLKPILDRALYAEGDITDLLSLAEELPGDDVRRKFSELARKSES